MFKGKIHKQNYLKQILPALLLTVFVLACNKNSKPPVIIDYASKQSYEYFQSLHLDSAYTNLLGSEKSEAEADSLYEAWYAFNKELAQMIREEHFDWETQDSSVILWNRVYCQGDGTIDYYLYYIRDSLINEKVGKKYGEFIGQHISNLKYPVNRDFIYAQCGSYRHKNYD